MILLLAMQYTGVEATAYQKKKEEEKRTVQLLGKKMQNYGVKKGKSKPTWKNLHGKVLMCGGGGCIIPWRNNANISVAVPQLKLSS